MNEDVGRLAERIEALGADRTSGASELLTSAIDILSAARTAGTDMRTVARTMCRAQPSMASIWNAAIAAVASDDDPERWARFTERVRRAQGALTRFAVGCFVDEQATTALRVVTISASASVMAALAAVHAHRPIHVACSEGRPALEGRRLAARFAEMGMPVALYSDAAIGHALPGADAVLVGADAIAPAWFLNKSGTRMLASAAAFQGIPVYVVATRDKFVGESLAAHLVIREGEPSEVWDTPPAGVAIRNPYFERTPLELITSIISDVGVLGAGMVPDVCAAMNDETALRQLLSASRGGGLT